MTALPHSSTDAVAVGIRANHDIRPFFLSKPDTQGQGVFIFRIWRRYSGEIAIRHFLLLHDKKVHETGFPQDFLNRHTAAAVEGRIHHLQRRRISMVTGFFEYSINKEVHHVLSQPGDEILPGPVIDGGQVFHLLHILRKHIGLFRHQLAAIFPIDLVAIVLRRIVTGRDDNAAQSVEMTD